MCIESICKDVKLNTNNWLTGFTDGDGCFFINIKRSKTHKLKKCVQLEYSIKQKDREILEKIKSYFGGNIYYIIKPNIYLYKITKKNELENLLKYFDEYNLMSKYVEYIKYREIYRMMERGEHLTIKGLQKIEKIKETFRD